MATIPTTWTPSAQAALARIKHKLFATVTEASCILGCDPQGRTVRRAIQEGAIPAVKVGNTYRVPVAWLREQAQAGTGSDAA